MTTAWWPIACPDHLLSAHGELGLTPCGPDFDERAAAAVIFASGEPYDSSVFETLRSAQIVARIGIGYDAVDLEAATRSGVLVTNTPEGPTTSTAEHAIALMMAVTHQLTESAARLRAGAGDYVANQTSMELSGRTLGLLGFGRIGQAVAVMARAIGMEIIVTDPALMLTSGSDPNINPNAADPAQEPKPGLPTARTGSDPNVNMNAAEPDVMCIRGSDPRINMSGIEVVDLAELFSRSDVLSIHAPATPATTGMIDAEVFAAMKPGSVLVNCARGPIVNTDDLVAALQSGHLLGAGLDVTEPEPLESDHPLLSMDNVIVTPHIASSTVAGRKRMNDMAFEQVAMALRGETPTHLLNPEVLNQPNCVLAQS